MISQLESFSEGELFTFISEEPLLAHLFVRSDICESTKYPYYASTCIRNGIIQLVLNPDKISSLPYKEKIGLLVHEYLHILLGHCTVRSIIKSSKIAKQNVAQDMAINQLILKTGVWNLPKDGIFHNVPPFYYDEGLTSEEYLSFIDRDFSDEEIDEWYGNNAIDYHGDWELSDSSLVKDLIEDYINKGKSDLGETLSLSKEHSSFLQKIESQSSSDKDWLITAKHFLCKNLPGKRKRTYKRPGKRYPFPSKGVLRKNVSKAAVIVDTSYSMSSASLGIILDALNKLSYISSIDVVMCDTEVKGEPFKNFQSSTELIFNGRGGTNLQPAFDLVENERYHSVICFTDGGSSEKIQTKVKTLWICINNLAFRPDVGQVCHVRWE